MTTHDFILTVDGDGVYATISWDGRLEDRIIKAISYESPYEGEGIIMLDDIPENDLERITSEMDDVDRDEIEDERTEWFFENDMDDDPYKYYGVTRGEFF